MVVSDLAVAATDADASGGPTVFAAGQLRNSYAGVKNERSRS